MADQTPVAPGTRNRNRAMFIAIGLAFLAPAVLAWLAFRFGHWSAADATSLGTLVHPARPVAGFSLQAFDGSAVPVTDYRGKWTMIYVSNGRCQADCDAQARNFNITRLALGEDSQRVQGLVIQTEADAPTPAFIRDPELSRIHAAGAAGPDLDALTRLFAWPSGTDGRWTGRVYLVDPLGNLMMLYEPGSDPKDLLQDLRKLLKASRIG